jgi:Clp amino terminal domain, pathogenicity island component
VSSSEQRLCRLAQDAADAHDPLRALETLVELRGELEAVTRVHVERGLRAGRSFGDVARALGISRQAAHRRYRDLAPARRQVAATEQARRVLRVAGEEALTAKAAALGSEHVLVAVLRCGGDAAETLVRGGVTLEVARACARAIAAERSGVSGSGGPPGGLRGVLREATGVAAARGERWLDVDAVLLAALADPDGGARRLLTALGMDSAEIRGRLERQPDTPHPPTRNATRHGTAA